MLLSLISIAISQAQPLTPSEKAWLKAKGEIIFVSQTEYPPFEFIDNQQTRKGMCIELVRWIATEFGFRTRFIDMSFKEAQQAILSGKADVLTSLFYSKARDEKFDFTKMTWEVPSLIFVKSERPDIHSLDDLQGKRIAMQRGDYAGDFLQSKNVTYTLVSTATFAEAVNKVIAREADAVIGDKQIVLYHLFSHQLTDKIKSVGEPLYVGQNCMGTRDGNVELVSILNKGLSLAKDKGIISSIYKKWTGTQYSSSKTWIERHAYAIALFVIGLIVFVCVVIFWNYQLRRTVNRRTEKLLQNETQLRTLVNALPDLIWLKDKDGIYLGCNLRCESFFGAKESDIAGKTDYEFVDKELADFFRQKDKAAMAAGKPLMNEEEITFADDGHKELLETVKTPLLDHKNNLVGVLGIARDITERKKTEKELKESEQLLNSMLDSIQDGISIIDKDFTILRVNRVMKNWYMDKLPLEGKKCHACYQNLNTICQICPCLRSMETGKAEMEIVKGHEGSDIEWLELYSHPLYDAETGKVTGAVEFIRDISQQKRLEDQLQQAKKMEVIGLMAGGVAHDLNNILAGIVGYPELILQDLSLDSELRKPIKAIQESGNRAAAVVQDLLAVARGAASMREPYNLNSLVKEFLNSPEFNKIKSLHPNVTYQNKGGALQSSILCSSVHIKKSLMNLVINAAEAIVGEGKITIATEDRSVDEKMAIEQNMQVGDYVVLNVGDTGPGIPEKDVDHIFEPFYSKKVMGRSGTGLGLTVVWNTVLEHNGKIIVQSSNQGTCFQLYFPESKEEGATQAQKDTIKLNGNGEHILVVDDEPQLRDIASRMLQSLGYKVDSVSSGELALEFVQDNPVDLIVVDMQMEPGISGRQTYEQILKHYPDQRAIIASGYSESDDVKATLQIGASGFIKKPYFMEQLGQAVKKALES